MFAGEAGRHPWVAVKVYKHDQFTNNKEFEQSVQLEAKFLNVMRSLGHPHLIRTVAYYRRGLSDCFVFPWADLGNLRDYWKQSNLAANPEKRLAKGYLWWVFVQLRGLADAITLLHDRHMRHGNLKPENILCFRKPESILLRDSADRQPDSSCILVIADAGLAGANYPVTQLRTKASLAPKGSTPTYEPPEAGAWSGEPVSRCYDVWSMGCIYLEFLIWLVDGGEGLKDFHAELGRFGRFYQRTWSEGQQGTTGVSRQPEVDRRIAMLRAHPFSQGEGNPLGRLVELIDTKLLVHIGIRTLPLHPSPAAIGSDVIEWLPGGRANSDTMFAELSEILADESSFELPSSTLNGFAAAEIDHRRL